MELDMKVNNLFAKYQEVGKTINKTDRGLSLGLIMLDMKGDLF